MKKCLRCEQVYGDDTNFCLSDGSTLVAVSDSFASSDETPTVYSAAPPPTVYSNSPPTNLGGAPQFIPPVSPAAPAPAKKSNTLLIALVVGFFALLVGGAVVGVVMYGAMNSGGQKNENVAVVSNTDDKSNKNTSADKKSDNETSAQNLKAQQDKLDKDKQKLEEERRKLEEKKKESTPTSTTPPSSARTAVIIDPPSNIRRAPNGSVLCVARTRGTVVNITGATGVSDNNGSWYYTDYCGSQGVIHSTQIRF